MGCIKHGAITRNRDKRIIFYVMLYQSSSLPPQLMGYWEWRWGLPSKGQPPALQQSGRNPTLGRADKSRVGLPSLWCGPHTGASGGSGCHHIGSACSTHSGRTAPEQISSDRREKKKPNPERLPPDLPHKYFGPEGQSRHKK